MVLFRKERFMSITHRYVIGMGAESSTEKTDEGFEKSLWGRSRDADGKRKQSERAEKVWHQRTWSRNFLHPALKAEDRCGDDEWLA